MFKKFTQIFCQIKKKKGSFVRQFSRKKKALLSVSKRRKFIIGIATLSLILFFSEYFLSHWGIYIAFLLSILTALFFYWAERLDLQDNFSPQTFILTIFYTLACALFYFLIPARLATRVGMTSLYAFGLYSLFLSENIFIVSSVRTIALSSSARIVSFVVAMVSYFFMTDVIFSLHLNILVTLLLIFIFSFFLIQHSIWTHTLEKSFKSNLEWVLLIAVCIVEVALALWFWPTNPTLVALFLTGLFYILVGVSQVWLDKRLFKSIMWEYIWVAVIIFIVFVTFSTKS